MRHNLQKTCLALSAVLSLSPCLMAATLFGPEPYLSPADTPVDFYGNAPMEIEDFEDGQLSPQIGVSSGARIIVDQNAAGQVDSVDIDDGVIDGSGLDGTSLFCACGPAGITVTFPEGTTSAGLVWTDGAGVVTFEAFGPNGSLGSISESDFVDGSFTGGTADDRFFGASSPEGITSLRISNSVGGIEIDHIQYEVVPEPTSAFLLVFGIAALFRRRVTR